MSFTRAFSSMQTGCTPLSRSWCIKFFEVWQARIGECQRGCDALSMLCRHQSKSGDVKGARTGASSGAAVPRSSSTASQVSSHLRQHACWKMFIAASALNQDARPERVQGSMELGTTDNLGACSE